MSPPGEGGWGRRRRSAHDDDDDDEEEEEEEKDEEEGEDEEGEDEAGPFFGLSRGRPRIQAVDCDAIFERRQGKSKAPPSVAEWPGVSTNGRPWAHLKESVGSEGKLFQHTIKFVAGVEGEFTLHWRDSRADRRHWVNGSLPDAVAAEIGGGFQYTKDKPVARQRATQKGAWAREADTRLHELAEKGSDAVAAALEGGAAPQPITGTLEEGQARRQHYKGQNASEKRAKGKSFSDTLNWRMKIVKRYLELIRAGNKYPEASVGSGSLESPFDSPLLGPPWPSWDTCVIQCPPAGGRGQMVTESWPPT